METRQDNYRCGGTNKLSNESPSFERYVTLYTQHIQVLMTEDNIHAYMVLIRYNLLILHEKAI